MLPYLYLLFHFKISSLVNLRRSNRNCRILASKILRHSCDCLYG